MHDSQTLVCMQCSNRLAGANKIIKKKMTGTVGNNAVFQYISMSTFDCTVSFTVNSLNWFGDA